MGFRVGGLRLAGRRRQLLLARVLRAGRRGVSAAGATGLCVGLAVLAGAAALALRRVRDFAKKGAACILLCGVLFAFANPPMQTPDETDHYLRTYAISMGRFDFDAQRGYPEDVDELVAAFPGAWVNAHTSAGLGTDPDTHAEQPFNSAGYALKQYGKDGRVESIRDSFEQYLTWLYRDSVPQRVTEPVSFLILPFLPGALGMALARLFGLGALGCLYGGRLVNLLALHVAVLCSAAQCAQMQTCVFVHYAYADVALHGCVAELRRDAFGLLLRHAGPADAGRMER